MAVGQTQRNILLPKSPSSYEYQLIGVNKAATCKKNNNNNHHENKFLKTKILFSRQYRPNLHKNSPQSIQKSGPNKSPILGILKRLKLLYMLFCVLCCVVNLEKWNLAIKNVLIYNNLNLINNLVCIMRVSYSQKHQKCEVAVVKEDKKRKVFLYFYASLHLLSKVQMEFRMVRSGLVK